MMREKCVTSEARSRVWKYSLHKVILNVKLWRNALEKTTGHKDEHPRVNSANHHISPVSMFYGHRREYMPT